MVKYIMCILLMCISVKTKGNDRCLVEIRIMPLGGLMNHWGGNVTTYAEEKESIMIPYYGIKYAADSLADSVYYFYYSKVYIPCDLFDTLRLKHDQSSTPSIKKLMVVMPNSDTIFVDRNLNIIINDKCYIMTDRIKYLLEHFMPISLRENWEKWK